MASRPDGAAQGRKAEPSGSLNAATPRVSLGDIVAERLREAILNDELRPGQALREEELSESLQVSRGPVRDAFILLERQGLVRLSRHRGARVVELSHEDFAEVYSLRLALEELAVKLALRRAEERDLDALESSLKDLRTGLRHRLTEHEAARLDVEFHDAIFRAAHHERLYACWSTIRMQVYWFLCRRNVANADWRSATIKGHEEILAFIRAGAEPAATEAIRMHISTAYSRIIAPVSGDTTPADDASDVKRVAESFLLL